MVAHVSPNKKTDGIICDLCSKVYTNKFRYYSAKFDLVEVDKAIGKSGIVQVDRRAMDLDVCEECMNKIKEQVLKLIKSREDGKGEEKWEVRT